MELPQSYTRFYLAPSVYPQTNKSIFTLCLKVFGKGCGGTPFFKKGSPASFQNLKTQDNRLWCELPQGRCT